MLGSFFFTIVAFLVAISILIAIHEFGHFWVAKRLGVKVLRYSIGFGKPLWRFVGGRDRTEYVIAALPIGGYVKMLDEREGEVAEADLPRAFNRQPVAKRFAIVLAGPLFNFLLAIVIYWLVFVIGVSGVRPQINGVKPDTPAAQAGLHRNQEIVAVNGQATPTWTAAMQALLPNAIERSTATLTVREADGSNREVKMDLSGINMDDVPARLFQAMGIEPWRPKVETIIGSVQPGSPAELAGLRAGDRIIQLNGEPIHSWHLLVVRVQPLAGQSVKVTVMRGERKKTIDVTPRSVQQDGKTVGQLGIRPKQRAPIPKTMQATYRYGPLAAIGQSLHKTWEMSTLTLKMLGKMIVGEASVKNLSGPINIAHLAGESASAGPMPYLDFIAIVSISLGILNLLPIPILDGGHLLWYIVEMVKGRPVSEATEAAGQRIGIVLLLLLMGLAFYNDLARLFGQ
ncbi:MAG: RIP metalloprotease RseP [Gammaproteobacteria bacterium]